MVLISTSTGAAPASRYGDARMSRSRACNATSSASPMRPGVDEGRQPQRVPQQVHVRVDAGRLLVVELRLPRQRVAVLVRGFGREEPKGVEVRAP